MASIPSRKSFSDVARLSSYTSALPGIAELLNKMVAKGDSRGRGEGRTAFDGSKPAPVSIQDYLIRMCKYGYCSNEVFVCMVIYLGRIRARVGTTFTSHNIHRLLLTSFVVAAKLRDDTYYSNKYYASIGGVSLPDMNKMEQCFLRCTGWELHISKKEYDQYYAAMANSSSRRNSHVRSGVPAAGEAQEADHHEAAAHGNASPSGSPQSNIAASHQSTRTSASTAPPTKASGHTSGSSASPMYPHIYQDSTAPLSTSASTNLHSTVQSNGSTWRSHNVS
eukprot:TRINITY_DN5438_c0_g1_i1.p1 TRINITY_DN5438_c0_g1~~TRINITY_DN5438_c0_g1_i1.p1  ORF type:complete len:279 (+),score=103.66 TRINITY_DN5438_c0_g1_i1:176-1012(+)